MYQVRGWKEAVVLIFINVVSNISDMRSTATRPSFRLFRQLKKKNNQSLEIYRRQLSITRGKSG